MLQVKNYLDTLFSFANSLKSKHNDQKTPLAAFPVFCNANECLVSE